MGRKGDDKTPNLHQASYAHLHPPSTWTMPTSQPQPQVEDGPGPTNMLIQARGGGKARARGLDVMEETRLPQVKES